MDKNKLRQLLLDAGDAIVTYRSPKSKKVKYNVVTLDFDTRHIREKRNFSKETDSTLLTFSWDTDSFRLLKTELILSVVPLAAVLKNER